MPNRVNAAFPEVPLEIPGRGALRLHLGSTFRFCLVAVTSTSYQNPSTALHTCTHVAEPIFSFFLRYRVDRPISAISVLVLRLLREFRFLDVHAVLLLTRKMTRLIEHSFYTYECAMPIWNRKGC